MFQVYYCFNKVFVFVSLIEPEFSRADRGWQGWDPNDPKAVYFVEMRHVCQAEQERLGQGRESKVPHWGLGIVWMLCVFYVVLPCLPGGGFETILCLRDTAPTRCVRNDRWFQTFFMFTPKIGEDFPFDEHIFQMGWFETTNQLSMKKHPSNRGPQHTGSQRGGGLPTRRVHGWGYGGFNLEGWQSCEKRPNGVQTSEHCEDVFWVVF